MVKAERGRSSKVYTMKKNVCNTKGVYASTEKKENLNTVRESEKVKAIVPREAIARGAMLRGHGDSYTVERDINHHRAALLQTLRGQSPELAAMAGENPN